MDSALPRVVSLMRSDLSRFYEECAGDMIRLCAALVGPHLAEDIFAEAMLRVLQNTKWLALPDDDRRAYLYRTMVNEAHRYTARRSKGEVLESILSARRPVHGEDEYVEDLLPQLATLSVRQRAVVYLTYWEDLSAREVANRLGISEGSVYQHVARARSRLRVEVMDG